MENPLTGENGASRVFAPQKGADEEMVKALDANLKHLAGVIERELGVDVDPIPGAGRQAEWAPGCWYLPVRN